MTKKRQVHIGTIKQPDLKQKLADEGFDTTQRTIQRDLMRLSTIYPLACDEEGKPFGWSWMAEADVMDIPGMDSHTALAFLSALPFTHKSRHSESPGGHMQGALLK